MDRKRENQQIADFLIRKDWADPKEVVYCLALAEQKGVSIVDLLVQRDKLPMNRAMEVKRLFTPKGPTQIPGYRILSRLGVGGMGSVYEGESLKDKRRVAIKVMHKEISKDEEYILRFLREVKLMIRLHHPNIVACYDYGKTKQGFYYYVMEFVEGQNGYLWLETKRQQGALPTEREVAYIGAQVAAAMVYYNKEGVVHRDIKPDNLIITPKGVTKLCDLGLAKRESLDTRITEAGVTLGTPHYFSPEQAKGEKLDIRSDIYSLGATLFHFLAGQEPYPGKNIIQVMQAHIYSPIPSLREFRNISNDMEYVIRKMMAKEKEERYQTPEELYRDLYYLAKQGKIPKKKVQVLTKKALSSSSSSTPLSIPLWVWIVSCVFFVLLLLLAIFFLL